MADQYQKCSENVNTVILCSDTLCIVMIGKSYHWILTMEPVNNVQQFYPRMSFNNLEISVETHEMGNKVSQYLSWSWDLANLY